MAADKIDIASFKHTLRNGTPGERAALAAGADTPPEILCFLTEDADPAVRCAVAGNPETPAAAHPALSRDPDISVRVALARTLVGDGLDDAARQTLWRTGFTILETLMRDQVVRVRKALAIGLAPRKDAPPPIIARLARDEAEEVGSPVLSASPVLSDSDMIGYLKDGAPGWAQSAIASRPQISQELSSAIVQAASPPALATLAANQGAALNDSAFEDLALKAETDTGLQTPLVERDSLPGSILVRLARFVAAPLLGILCKRRDIEEATARRMNRAIESRPDAPDIRAVPSGPEKQPAVSSGNGIEPPAMRAARLFQEGKLSNDTVALALDSHQRDFVIAALALRSGIAVDRARRMVSAESARTMVRFPGRRDSARASLSTFSDSSPVSRIRRSSMRGTGSIMRCPRRR